MSACVCVCLTVNHGGINHNRYMQRQCSHMGIRTSTENSPQTFPHPSVRPSQQSIRAQDDLFYRNEILLIRVKGIPTTDRLT